MLHMHCLQCSITHTVYELIKEAHESKDKALNTRTYTGANAIVWTILIRVYIYKSVTCVNKKKSWYSIEIMDQILETACMEPKPYQSNNYTTNNF